MRVLIVEDNASKAARIEAAVAGALGGAKAEFVVVGNAYDASLELKESRFDLMVVDVFLPLRRDCDAAGDGGIHFLREIRKPSKEYKLPVHIVGLTAYKEVHERWRHAFEEGLWPLIVFDETSTDWADALAEKVTHIRGSGEHRVVVPPKDIKGARQQQLEGFPSYVALAPSYRGFMGWKVLWLAVLTIGPLGVRLKVQELGLVLSPASIVYVLYHCLGLFVLLHVLRACDTDIPLTYGEDGFRKLWWLHRRFVVPLGIAVVVILVATFLAKAQLALGEQRIGPIELPQWLLYGLGV